MDTRCGRTRPKSIRSTIRRTRTETCSESEGQTGARQEEDEAPDAGAADAVGRVGVEPRPHRTQQLTASETRGRGHAQRLRGRAWRLRLRWRPIAPRLAGARRAVPQATRTAREWRRPGGKAQPSPIDRFRHSAPVDGSWVPPVGFRSLRRGCALPGKRSRHLAGGALATNVAADAVRAGGRSRWGQAKPSPPSREMHPE